MQTRKLHRAGGRASLALVLTQKPGLEACLRLVRAQRQSATFLANRLFWLQGSCEKTDGIRLLSPGNLQNKNQPFGPSVAVDGSVSEAGERPDAASHFRR